MCSKARQWDKTGMIYMDSQTKRTRFQHQWDTKLYDTKHAFVSHLGAELVELLAPQRGECILDLGCGTGYLTDKISTSEAEAVGIDSAPAMIEQARANYLDLKFEVADGRNLQFTEQFDGVFSNAVLHWITEPEKAIAGVWHALKPGGRFVAEFGGKGNVKLIISALNNAIQSAGYPAINLNPWYFPSIGEYGTLLEKQGLQLIYAIYRLISLGYGVPGAILAIAILLPLATVDRFTYDMGWQVPALTGSVLALVYAYNVRFTSAALQSVDSGLQQITRHIDESARILGRTPRQVLWHVHLPVLRGSVATGMLLVIVDVIKELPATLVLRPFDFDTLAVVSYQFASDERLTEAAVPALMIVMIALVPILLLIRQGARQARSGKQ